MNKYIKFENQRPSDSGKTSIWDVTIQTGGVIGEVRWFGRWRQYSFHPAPLTVFERGCLRTIADFCESSTRAHARRT